MRNEINKTKIPNVSEFYNPFSIQYFGIAESLRRYKELIMTNEDLRKKLKKMDDDVAFGCYCKGEECHTPTLIECFKELKTK